MSVPIAIGTSSLNTPGFVNVSLKQPYGIVAAIIPWNLPLFLLSSKLARAFATGNTVVLKSSEKAPLTSAKVASLIEPHGGKSPAIVFDNANIELAAAETKNSIQWNSGQSFMANSRIYVQDTNTDRFMTYFRKNFEAVTFGNPADRTTNHGPIADEIQFNIVRSYIDSGKQSSTLILGGGIPENTKGGCEIMKEEIFGPVVSINIFHTEEEVMEKANDMEYGLYASVYTKDIDRTMQFAKGLEAGTVGINCTSPSVAHDMPFGGWKASGTGREGYLTSIDNFLATKTALIKLAV